MPYALPALHYELQVEHAVTACPQQFTLAAGDRSVTFWDDNLRIKTKVVADRHYIAGERYIADYRSLASFLKTTGYGLETYPSGVLKSINVSAEDQSAPLIKDVVAAGLSIARLASGGGDAEASTNFKSSGIDLPIAPPPPPPVAPAPSTISDALKQLQDMAETTSVPHCRAKISDAMAAKSAAAAVVERESAQLERVTRQVARYTLIASSDHADRSDLMKLDTALAQQAEIEDRLKLARDDLQKKKNELSVSDALGWTPRRDGLSDGLEPTAPAQFDSLFLVRSAPVLRREQFLDWWRGLPATIKGQFRTRFTEFVKAYGVADKDPPLEPFNASRAFQCSGNSVSGCIVPGLTLYPSLTVVEGMAAEPKPAGARIVTPAADKSSAGLFIRSQRLADFRLCVGEKSAGACPPERLVVVERGVPSPQLGQLRFLPFSNRMFEAAKLSLSMREDGSVERFKYDRTKTVSSGSEAIRDAISQYEAYRDKEEKDAEAAVAAARAEAIADLDHQIALLTKQKELLKLQTPEEPDAQQAIKDETAALNAEIALLNAKLEKLKAEEALLTAAGGTD